MIEAYSIQQFCDSHNISRSLFYLLEKEGRVPKTFKVGRRRLVSREAAEKWRREMEGTS